MGSVHSHKGRACLPSFAKSVCSHTDSAWGVWEGGGPFWNCMLYDSLLGHTTFCYSTRYYVVLYSLQCYTLRVLLCYVVCYVMNYACFILDCVLRCSVRCMTGYQLLYIRRCCVLRSQLHAILHLNVLHYAICYTASYQVMLLQLRIRYRTFCDVTLRYSTLFRHSRFHVTLHIMFHTMVYSAMLIYMRHYTTAY